MTSGGHTVAKVAPNAPRARRVHRRGSDPVADKTPRSPSEIWFVYILRCADDSLYTGIARDVRARLLAHESGRGARYTRSRGPFILCKTRRCANKGAALRLEYAIKRLPKAAKEQLLVGRRLGRFASALT